MPSIIDDTHAGPKKETVGMWIERIDFAGFGSISGEKIEFPKDKLSLAIEPNESGKATLISVIWATLFGFGGNQIAANHKSEREARRPRAGSGLPFIAGIDISARGRLLKVIRDFSDGSVQIIDLANNNADVTAEFGGVQGEDQVGLRLSGMTRELFLATCLIGRKQLGEHLLQGETDLNWLIQTIANMNLPATTSSAVNAIIDEVFHNFPYRSGKYKIELVLRDLEGRFNELSERVRQFEEDRRTLGLAGMQKRGQDQEAEQELSESQIKTNEYFDLCLEAADLANRLVQGLETLVKVKELNLEIERVEHLKHFPVDEVKQVDELWTRRQSRTDEYDALYEELAPKIEELETAESEISERYGGLQGFTPEDAQTLGALAVNLRTCTREIEELKDHCQQELQRIRQLDVDPEELANIRREFEGLEQRDYDDARSYAALITSFQQGIAESERSIEKARAQLDEIEEQKKSKKPIFQIPGGGGKRKEQIAAERDIDLQKKHIDELRTKISGLGVRLDGLARKCGITDGQQLLRKMQAYQTKSINLKDLEALQRDLGGREAALSKISTELQSYFNRAGRHGWGISTESALELTTMVSKFVEDSRSLNATFGEVRQSRQQLDFLASEIRDIDSLLKELFAVAGVETRGEIEDAHRNFFATLAAFHRYQAMKDELRAIECDMSSGFTPDELPPQMERLETQRREVWNMLLDMVNNDSEIAEIGVPAIIARENSTQLQTEPAARMRTHIDSLRSERDTLTACVRSSPMNYDRDYMDALAEMEIIERDLHNLKRLKMALELTRDQVERISVQEAVDWPLELSNLGSQLLENIGLGYEDVHGKNRPEEQEKDRGRAPSKELSDLSKKLSVGTKEQLYWLVRVIINRFTAKDSPLPIILDEPFEECDQERFSRIMHFLSELIGRKHQVIICSHHEEEMTQLLQILPDSIRLRLHVAKRMPMLADAVAAG